MDGIQWAVLSTAVLVAGFVQGATGMGFQILGEGERARQGLLKDWPRPAFGQVIDKRDCRNELAIFGEMALQ